MNDKQLQAVLNYQECTPPIINMLLLNIKSKTFPEELDHCLNLIDLLSNASITTEPRILYRGISHNHMEYNPTILSTSPNEYVAINFAQTELLKIFIPIGTKVLDLPPNSFGETESLLLPGNLTVYLDGYKYTPKYDIDAMKAHIRSKFN